jgi:hypothetical protein
MARFVHEKMVKCLKIPFKYIIEIDPQFTSWWWFKWVWVENFHIITFFIIYNHKIILAMQGHYILVLIETFLMI